MKTSGIIIKNVFISYIRMSLSRCENNLFWPLLLVLPVLSIDINVQTNNKYNERVS